jgi:hypothetical protein
VLVEASVPTLQSFHCSTTKSHHLPKMPLHQLSSLQCPVSHVHLQLCYQVLTTKVSTRCRTDGKKVKQSHYRPGESQEVEAPRFQDNRHMKVVRLSALRTGRLYSPRNIPGTHFCYRMSQPQGHGAARRIMSMKIQMTSSGIESNCLNQLRHCMSLNRWSKP